ncbi:uncharacterized protein E0L32_000276 [Thyridium curvatum]|uniref:F-box domain-containing protein n=1 Tax=Thyridium curvatum TaxID=1093900 RepID=A0A507B101_9PEZI|nr:uncharacterized protein E0L32_000276 [Thyridium curvatum]TPX15942.1 hypothetical protein E0L32_000276 [Thyridium curvatum]
MATPSRRVVFPWEGRDQDEQAKIAYNEPLRLKNKELEDENMRLKKLLREHGVPWSPAIANRFAELGFEPQQSVARRQSTRRTRASTAASSIESTGSKLPRLPAEILLRIVHYAMTSSEPLVDPLSPTRPENITIQEKSRHKHLALGFLASCKAFRVEATRALWANNTFVFTTPQALLKFADLEFVFRSKISHVNLRIIAQFYDDEPRKHKLDKDYHPTLKKDVNLRVQRRPKETSFARKGFHCYAWTQVIDFLSALRAPYDPKHEKNANRPRLFPNLKTMRLDFVSFPEYFLPYSDSSLHEVAAHDLGCTLDELIVCGLPSCEVGMKASADLAGMIKDDGLLLDGTPAFLQLRNCLKPLQGYNFVPKVIRAYRKAIRDAKNAAQANGAAASNSTAAQASHDHHHAHELIEMPPAPEELGHPESRYCKRKTIWKRVPVSSDSDQRDWMEFDRFSGYPIDDVVDLWDDSDEEDICSKCGEFHGSMDYLDFDEL